MGWPDNTGEWPGRRNHARNRWAGCDTGPPLFHDSSPLANGGAFAQGFQPFNLYSKLKNHLGYSWDSLWCQIEFDTGIQAMQIFLTEKHPCGARVVRIVLPAFSLLCFGLWELEGDG